jgi:hypothetical protein
MAPCTAQYAICKFCFSGLGKKRVCQALPSSLTPLPARFLAFFARLLSSTLAGAGCLAISRRLWSERTPARSRGGGRIGGKSTRNFRFRFMID